MNANSRCLGLIGGLGVGATVHYYRELAKAHERAGVPLKLLMVHADMHRVFRHVQAGEVSNLARYLAELIGHLEAGGAGLAAISAVMPHICVDELLAIAPLPLINLLDAAVEEIEARKLRRLAIFGTRFTIGSGLFGALRGVELIMPNPGEVDYIHKTYLEVALTGAGSEKHREGLTNLAHTLLERDGVEAIVLAGTDLSLLFDESNTLFPHVDCSRLHLDSILRSLLA